MVENGSLAKTTVSELFDAAGSTNPTPGGGCVSGVCGYLGISLLLKSIRISARKQPDDTSYAAVERKLLALSNQLLAFSQADSDSFADYMNAVRLPKSSPEEQTIRDKALQRAAVKATEASLNILDVGNEVLDVAHQVQFRVLPIIRTDEKSCVELISAMSITAQNNASSNMNGMESNAPLRKRLADAAARYLSLLAACHSV